MIRSLKTLAHAAFWAVYLFIVAAIMFAATRNEEFGPGDTAYYILFVTGVAIIPPVISFYAHFYFLFRHYLQKRQVALTMVLSALIAIGAMATGLLFSYVTNEEASACIDEGLPYAATFTTGIAWVLGGVALIIKGFLTWFEELKLKEELLEKTHKMEMALVKAQLDPHFLFNTINNIDVLIEKEPQEASQYLQKLSDIMRYVLYQTRGEVIPLSDELEYIEKYIELQKIRTGNNNFINYSVHGNLNGQRVAPMVFIPFVENAFKHTNNKKINDALNIEVRIEDGSVVFKCRNKYDRFRSSTHEFNGLGNDLIERRLKLLYPESHTLKIKQSDDSYTVELTIPDGRS